MVGKIYELRSLRWKVTKTFWRNGEEFAVLKCVNKRKKQPWEVPIIFLIMMDHRKVS